MNTPAENLNLNISTPSNTIILKGLEGAVNHCLNNLDINYFKLLQIAENNLSNPKSEFAADGIAKVVKLKDIAYDLIVNIKAYSKKLNRSSSLIADRSNQSEKIEEFVLETELLNDMHYNVSKEFFSFINMNFQTKIINIQNIAA